jgi:hypothetical protein
MSKQLSRVISPLAGEGAEGNVGVNSVRGWSWPLPESVFCSQPLLFKLELESGVYWSCFKGLSLIIVCDTRLMKDDFLNNQCH